MEENPRVDVFGWTPALGYANEFWALIPKGLVTAPEIAEIARTRTLFSVRRRR